MSGRWALSLPRSELATAHRLRRVPRIELLDEGPFVWLRGEAADEQLDLNLRMIPGARRFAVLGDGQLQPMECRVPTGYLPAGPWTPLADWLDFELPVAAWPGKLPDRIPLTLVRSNVEGMPEATMLLTSLAAWSTYGRTAPRVRLDRWTFAADGRSRVFVRGKPLPPLPGQRFVVSAGVAIPAGLRLEPDVDAQTAWETLRREQLGLNDGDLAIFFPDNVWEHIPGDSFVKADRSAIRFTAEASNAAD
jgi:hypothetical protein